MLYSIACTNFIKGSIIQQNILSLIIEILYRHSVLKSVAISILRPILHFFNAKCKDISNFIAFSVFEKIARMELPPHHHLFCFAFLCIEEAGEAEVPMVA